jgi:MSHA biogenesis protein MshL
MSVRGLNLIIALLLLACLPYTAHANADERFDVEVSDAPARAFFTGLVAGTSQNLLVHPQVSGTVSLSLKQVTIKEVLEAVKEMYGYDYRPVTTGYMVMPATVQTRLFQVSYLDISRKGVSRTRVSSGQLTQGGNQQYGSGSGSNSIVQPQDSGGDQNNSQNSESTGSAVMTNQETDFWGMLEQTLRAIVGTGPDRNVIVSPQSGVVMVHASPSQLRDVGDYLRRTEQAMTRQVVLEAKIIEVELGDAYQAGVNWGAVMTQGSRQYFLGQSSPLQGFDANQLQQLGRATNVGPGNPIANVPIAALGGAFTMAADMADFGGFIELLALQGDTRVLSSPRVSTLNNQKAVIKAGFDEFFVTDVSSNTVTSTAASTSRDVEFTPFFSGVALDVTPQISETGDVILHIHPSVSEVRDQNKSITVGGVTDTIPLAFSQIRESDSIVKAKNGQVIVIGGLMRETREKKQYKTPFLGSIPVLGHLFRSERDSGRTVELVILLRPIVVDDSSWDQLVKEPLDRIEKLKEVGDKATR